MENREQALGLEKGFAAGQVTVILGDSLGIAKELFQNQTWNFNLDKKLVVPQ